MTSLARRGHAETGVVIPTTDAEAFIRGSARGRRAADRPVESVKRDTVNASGTLWTTGVRRKSFPTA